MGIATVAVYSEADAKDAAHVARRRFQAVLIGPAAARESYLVPETGCIAAAPRPPAPTAIHPGYGFLSENADFAERGRGRGPDLDRPAQRARSAPWA